MYRYKIFITTPANGVNDGRLDQSEGEDVAGGVTFHASSTNHRPAFRVKCDAALLSRTAEQILLLLFGIFLSDGSGGTISADHIHRRTRLKSQQDVKIMAH